MARRSNEDERAAAGAIFAIARGLIRNEVGIDCLASFTPRERRALAFGVREHELNQREQAEQDGGKAGLGW